VEGRRERDVVLASFPKRHGWLKPC
jgi:hypothetical protein